MKLINLFLILILSFAFIFPLSSATLSVQISDLGSGVKIKSTGLLLSGGNLSVFVYDSASGGNLIYSENFTDSIINGSWSVTLGENSSNPLYLEFNRKYYKDYLVNNEDVNFTFNNGTETSRKSFYSSLGELGRGTNASGTYSAALGYSTNSSGYASFAAGHNAQSIGNYSTALGNGTLASGLSSFAAGSSSNASGSFSTAIGYRTKATQQFATAFGHSTNASGLYSFALGYSSTATGESSVAMGFQTVAGGDYSVSVGHGTNSSGFYSFAAGHTTKASGDKSFAVGEATIASGEFSTSMGYQSHSSASSSFSWGGDSCSVLSQDCVNNRQGVFAIFGGLCVANATTACPDISDGVAYMNDAMLLNPKSLAPESASEGMVYYSSNAHKPCYYNGSAWLLFNDSTCI